MDKSFVDAMMAQNAKERFGHTNNDLVIVPDNCRIDSLEKFANKPLRTRKSVDVSSEKSFVDYVNHFKKDGSVVYFSTSAYSMQCVIDHFTPDKPSWCDHSVNYCCEKSDEWQKWSLNDKRKMNQSTFADFLEDSVKDIVDPSGSVLLEIATKFRVIKKAVFGSAKNLATGEFQFQYSEENQKGTIEIPTKFTIGIPAFENGDGYSIEARLKYRLSEGHLSFWYELINPKDVIKDAFDTIKGRVDESVNCLSFDV